MSRDPVAERLSVAVARRGMNQTQFAEALGTKQGTVQAWLADGAPIKSTYLSKIPSALGISGHWLLTGEGPMEAPGVLPDIEAARQEGATGAFQEILRIVREAGVPYVAGPTGIERPPTESHAAVAREALEVDRVVRSAEAQRDARSKPPGAKPKKVPRQDRG